MSQVLWVKSYEPKPRFSINQAIFQCVINQISSQIVHWYLAWVLYFFTWWPCLTSLHFHSQQWSMFPIGGHFCCSIPWVRIQKYIIRVNKSFGETNGLWSLVLSHEKTESIKAVIYTMSGGMKAVIWTDCLQSFVMMFSMIFLSKFSIWAISD